MTPPKTLQSALTYAKLGWSIVPFRTDSKRPWLSSWTDFQRKPLTNADLTSLWQERPGANVGAITGKISDLTVIDLDGIHAPTLLKAKGISLPRARVHKTPHGWHCLYCYIPSLNTEAGLLVAGDECDCFHDGQPKKCQIDVRNDGGCIVLPPSVYGGQVYTVLRDLEPAEWREIPGALTCKPLAQTGGRRSPRSTDSRTAPNWLRLVFDALVDRLEALGKQPRFSGEQVLALCPLHDDRQPSLSLHPTRGWKCFAGCGQGRLTRLANLLDVRV
ncbi:MAG: bifunctional DNA primase/polymerase [Chloroflexi bacterium]|nr:bifunctional DNA primase/polymerase [Chloroflexota bacterium]